MNQAEDNKKEPCRGTAQEELTNQVKALEDIMVQVIAYQIAIIAMLQQKRITTYDAIDQLANSNKQEQKKLMEQAISKWKEIYGQK